MRPEPETETASSRILARSSCLGSVDGFGARNEA